jgi:hypothetical protein
MMHAERMESDTMQRWTMPKTIGAGRLMIVPLLVLVAVAGRTTWFLILFGLALARE